MNSGWVVWDAAALACQGGATHLLRLRRTNDARQGEMDLRGAL